MTKSGNAPGVDETHDPERRSWVLSAAGHSQFPIQNLPFGVFEDAAGNPRTGVAIGDEILDLAAALEAGFFKDGGAEIARVVKAPTLNAYLALAAPQRRALRRAISDLLSEQTPQGAQAKAKAIALLHRQADRRMRLPAEVGDYTDFFAGIHHARNAAHTVRGSRDSLWPNYLHVPIAYHGRASSVEVSGGEVPRPNGQRLAAGEETPTFGPSLKLDYEFEFGAWIGVANPRGRAVPIREASDAVAGFCLLNDWSARDIQMWESQPLGPFLAKNFATFVSPWIVTKEALAPFLGPVPARAPNEPKLLDYLFDADDQAFGALNTSLQTFLLTERMRASGKPAVRVSAANTRDLYWTFAQMVAHHTSGGCPLRPGDLFGSGTISGPQRDGYGSLIELTDGGGAPIDLGDGEVRAFLEDGDEVIFRARCERDGFVAIGFGECRGRIVSELR